MSQEHSGTPWDCSLARSIAQGWLTDLEGDHVLIPPPTITRNQLVTVAKALLAISETTRAIPEGWMLVPVEPTQDMIDAGAETMHPRLDYGKQAAVAYRLMISNAPEAP